jgi:hypothetical protein
LVGLFIWGLNVDVFAEYINDYNDDPTCKPGSVSEVMTNVAEFYESRMTTDPRLRAILEGTDQSGNFGAFLVEPTKEEVGDKAVVKCQLCDKGKHSAKDCFRILEEAFVEEWQSRVLALKLSMEEKRKASKGPAQGRN